MGKRKFEKDIPSLTEEIARLEAETTELKEEIAKLEEEIAKLEEEITRLKAEFSKLEEEEAKLEEQHAKLEEEIARLKTEIAKPEEEEAKLEEHHAKEEEQLEKLDEQLVNLYSKLYGELYAKEDELLAKQDAILAKRDERNANGKECYAKQEETIAKMHELNVKMHELNVKLEEQRAKLKEQRAKLKEQRAMSLEEKKRESIEILLKYMPRLAKNPDCTPSIPSSTKEAEVEQQWKQYYIDKTAYDEEKKAIEEGTVSERKKSRPKEPSCRRPAKIENENLDDYIDFDFKTRERGWPIGSTLMGQWRIMGRSSLTLFSKGCIKTYLHDALLDVLMAYGMTRMNIIMECSLFSIWPDLMVLRFFDIILFFIEVENPSTPTKDVCTSGTAVGKAYDYNLALRQSGHDCPLTIISTYSETVIVREAASDDQYSAFLSKAKELLKKEKMIEGDVKKTDKKPVRVPILSNKHFQRKIARIEESEIVTQSKDEDTKHKVESQGRDDDRAGNNDNPTSDNENDDIELRKAKVSNIFSHEKLYKVIALVSAASILAFEASKESREKSSANLVPEDGYEFKGGDEDVKYCLESESFSWKRVKCTVSYTKPPALSTNSKYFVYSTHGHGGYVRTGKRILCSTTSGKMFVAKLFLVEPSSRSKKKARIEEEEDRRNEMMEKAKKEMNRWKHLNPKYKHYSNVILLNRTPALTMPFFSPIPIEERKGALEQIKCLLQKIANYKNNIDQEVDGGGNESLGDDEYYAFDEYGIRWRQFGCRYYGAENDKLEITALDLGLLKRMKCSDANRDEAVNSTVEKTIERLEKIMGSDPHDQVKHPIIR